jgi:hypothetical protein
MVRVQARCKVLQRYDCSHELNILVLRHGMRFAAAVLTVTTVT